LRDAGESHDHYGADKTGFMSAISAAAISECGDTLGVKAFNPDRKTVLHFDTEQSAMDHWKLCDSILRRAQLMKSTIFKSVCLTSVPILQRQAIIHHVIRQEGQQANGVFVALIDSHADLVRNVNDLVETADYFAALHALAIEFHSTENVEEPQKST
jgi:homoaconitase/3-isopropylmalate dehydratase large subunit